MMPWYNSKGKENDVVLSSRVRFARNIADYPFDSKIDETSCKEIIEKVSNALGDSFDKVDLNKMTQAEAMALVEKHYISNEFARKKMPHALLKNDKDNVSVMVCEEDHIRLQCVLPGLALENAYKSAERYDDILNEKLNIAFDSNLGFLTHCLTNLGLGMRVSVMMFLPALTMTRKMEQLSEQLLKLGLVVRGMYGEGSEPDGCLYQISNRVTMGVNEERTVNKLNDIVEQIADQERKERQKKIAQEAKNDSQDKQEIEKRHEDRYRSLLKDEESSAQLKKSTVKIWECLKCGHIVVGPEAPEYCPTCGEYNQYFEVREDNYDLILTWGR